MRIWVYVCVLLGLSGLMACHGPSESFVIQGQLINATHIQTAVLYEGDRVLDSAFLSENGKFRISRPSSQPKLFSLRLGKHRFPLILADGETLTFKADLSAPDGEYEVSGAPLSEIIKELATLENEKSDFEEELLREFNSLNETLDESVLTSLRGDYAHKYESYMQGYAQKIVAFANEHDNLAGFYAMTTLDPIFSETEIIRYAEKIEDKYDDNVLVRQFLEEASHLKRLAIGQPAPEFESRTVNNRLVKLSDFKGKYTLIDFWASWCVPCREENPNIVGQYERFNEHGFEVFGVSLDGNPGAWMKAIEQDQLEWVNVADLQAWKGDVVELYHLSAIPTSFILDPEGVIIAKDLRGEALQNFLEDLFDE